MAWWMALVLIVLPSQLFGYSLPPSLGELQVAVIVKDSSLVASANTAVFTTLNTNIQINSYGRTWLSGKVFVLPSFMVDCSADEWNRIISQLIQTYPEAATSDYYILFGAPCTGRGLWVYPRGVWMGSLGAPGILLHEFGHALRLPHSYFLDCHDVPIVADNTCEATVQADPVDPMGSPIVKHFGAPHKDALRWGTVLENPGSGTYTLTPMSVDDGGLKALKIPYPVVPFRVPWDKVFRSWLTIEYRQPTGIDSGLSAFPDLTRGAILRLMDEFCVADETPCDVIRPISYLLDFHPETDTHKDGALWEHSCYYLPDIQLNIFVEAKTSAGLPIRLAYGPKQCEPTPLPPPPPPPSLPTCDITAPKNGQTYKRRSTISVSVTSDGESVTVFDNGIAVCSDTTSPFQCSFSAGSSPNKNHTIVAYCSNQGGTSTSTAVTVTNTR